MAGTALQRGEQGAPIAQQGWQYYEVIANGTTVTPLASSTV
jgi:hypothetical protein